MVEKGTREKSHSFLLNGHTVYSDGRQFIILHPSACSNKGSYLDGGKTFVGYWLIYEALEECGIVANTAEISQINAIAEELNKKNKENR